MAIPRFLEEQEELEESCQLEEHQDDSASDSNQNCTTSLSKSETKGLSAMTKLKDVDLSKNYFKGHVSKEWMKLPSLRVLALSQNELTGSIPEEIWMASSLQRLDLVRVIETKFCVELS